MIVKKLLSVRKELSTALKKRKTLKRKKPKFPRQESFKHARLSESWRRPRGRHSKLRVYEKARGNTPNIGYRSPKEVRGLDRFGYREVRVFTVKDLDAINPKEEVAVIGGSVGRRKRMEIAKAAEERKITVKNF